jgi:hypothetical protein
LMVAEKGANFGMDCLVEESRPAFLPFPTWPNADMPSLEASREEDGAPVSVSSRCPIFKCKIRDSPISVNQNKRPWASFGRF